jgi:hypothetical protein
MDKNIDHKCHQTTDNEIDGPISRKGRHGEPPEKESHPAFSQMAARPSSETSGGFPPDPLKT